MRIIKYLLIGNKGQLGRSFEKYFGEVGAEYKGVDAEEMDVTDMQSVSKVFDEEPPQIVINCAAYNLVENAEKEPEPAYKVNRDGVGNVAEMCKKHGSFLVHYGTNHVFNGTKGLPYVEEDKTNPLNEYAKSKLAGEYLVKEKLPLNHLILRTSWLYGEGNQNFIYKFLKRCHEGQELVGVVDEFATPTSTRLLVDLTIRCLEKNLKGLYHAVNSGTASRWDWANEILNAVGENRQVKKVEVGYFKLTAKLPKDSTLSNKKISKDLGIEIPRWEDELSNFISDQAYLDFKL